MATLKWTAEAERWLGRIFTYITKDNPAAAARTVLAIYERTEILKQFPEMAIVISVILTGTFVSCYSDITESPT